MSENKSPMDFFDPTGMLKAMRGETMDAWSKAMVQFVNTDAYAEATGTILDAWLTTSTPFRKSIETSMAQALANLNMPTRAEIISMAERMTNLETRLDDMDAKLDEILRAASAPKAKTAKPAKPAKTAKAAKAGGAGEGA